MPAASPGRSDSNRPLLPSPRAIIRVPLEANLRRCLLDYGYRIFHAGAAVTLQVVTPRMAELADLMPIKEPPDLSKLIMSPMPGLLLRVSVEVGEEVHEGQEIAVVEAMKMENILRAERRGVVKSINAEQGDSLTADQIIVEFE